MSPQPQSKPYPAYKPSGVDWLGDVPAHWEVKVLKHIVVTPITDGPHETPEFFDEGVPFVSAEAISSGYIDFSKIRGFISEADHFRYSQKYQPQIGDIYMIKSGATTGITAIVETDNDFNIWSPLAAIRCCDKAVPRFILHFMRSKNFSEAVTLNWSFGTQQNIGMRVIENLSVTFPPFEEQTAIATFLDRETAKIDDLMAEQRRLIALLKEKRQAVISHAVTQGLNPNAPMKDSGIEWLGKVPAHWEVKQIKHLVSNIGSGKTPLGGSETYVDEGIIFLRSQNIYDEGLKLEEVAYISESVHKTMLNSEVHPGDILLNITGASIGRSCLVPKEFPIANVNQHVCIIRLNNLKNIPFVSWLFKSVAIKSQIDFSQNGAAREGLNYTQLMSMYLALPSSPNEQNEIVNFINEQVTKLNELLFQAERAIELLQERRTALISGAVTGKIDVRETAKVLVPA
jgi:type I restriction enzyme S subunit